MNRYYNRRNSRDAKTARATRRCPSRVISEFLFFFFSTELRRIRDISQHACNRREITDAPPSSVKRAVGGSSTDRCNWYCAVYVRNHKSDSRSDQSASHGERGWETAESNEERREEKETKGGRQRAAKKRTRFLNSWIFTFWARFMRDSGVQMTRNLKIRETKSLGIGQILDSFLTIEVVFGKDRVCREKGK